MWGNVDCIIIAASIALRDVRCSRLMLGSSVSWARYDAMVIASPSECGGRAAL